MAIECWIESLTFSDGSMVQLPRTGIVVLVGPNNTGKTQSLLDIVGLLVDNPNAASPTVIKEIRLNRTNDREDVLPWLERFAFRGPEALMIQYQRRGHTYVLRDLQMMWSESNRNALGMWTNLLTLYADVDSRTGIVSGTGPRDMYRGGPHVPIHFLYRDGSMEDRISRICEEVFGYPLTLQRLGLEDVLRLGRPDAPVPPLNRPTLEYANAEAALPPLAMQGHGIRSYMGLVLSLLVEKYPIYLVDEPEAFLHPPQRRSLGRLVARLAVEAEAQIIIATHDTEFLWGALDGPADVTVVRLTRDNAVNHARQIPAGDAATLWKDPLLRYSRLFDGIFYERLILCESDSDCRFYSAVLDAMVDDGELTSREVLFVPVGGKDRMAVAIEALMRAGVAVSSLLDFDALRDQVPLQRTVEACGGTWSRIERDLRVVASAVSQRTITRKSLAKLSEEIRQLLDGKNGSLDKLLSKEIVRIAAFKDGWDEAKRSGLAGVPAGEATEACLRVLAYLRSIGINISPYGELESFVKVVPGHGPEWVTEVLSRELHRGTEEARRFVRQALGAVAANASSQATKMAASI